MSIFNDKALKSVADAAAKIMAQEGSEGTHPTTEKEKKLAALAHPKDKITHKDVLVGRGVLKKEETEQIKEGDAYDFNRYAVKGGKATLHNPAKGEKDEPHHVWAESPSHALEKFKKKSMKEEVQLNEETTWQKIQRKKDEMEDKRREKEESMEHTPKEKKPVTSQKVAGHRYGGSKQKEETNEGFLPFTGMLEAYTERGLKALSGFIKEEPDNEQWTKELKDQEATASGKKKPASVAAPATKGVKIMPEEVEETELTLEDFTPEEIEEFMQSEEFEQLDELKKSTLLSYVNKAAHRTGQHAYDAGTAAQRGDLSRAQYHQKKEFKRTAGVVRAAGKLALGKTTNEDVEVIDFTDVNNVQKYTIKDEDIQQERALSEPEMKKKEEYVKGMKKKLSGFKQRYGERAKEVMYATATKMAKED